MDENVILKFICDIEKFLALAQKEQPNKNRFLVRKIVQQREEQGQYHTLVREVWLQDKEYLYRAVCNVNHRWFPYFFSVVVYIQAVEKLIRWYCRKRFCKTLLPVMRGAWKMEDGRDQSQAVAGTLRLYGNQA